MKKNDEKLNIRLEQLRKKLNKLIEKNNGKITNEIIKMSQELDLVIVEAIKK